MPDNPPRYIEPPPPPRAAIAVALVSNVIALGLLLFGQITAGEIFVGVAIAAGLVALFRSGAGRTGGTTARSSASANG